MWIMALKIGAAATAIGFASWLAGKKPELAGFIIALPLASILAFALPMAAQAAQDKDATLQKVESKYICMINDTLFDREQIPVEVNGKTYYGCCPICKEKLEKSAQARTATDPVSGATVDKATAIIGAQANGKVHYFENEENLKHYSGGDHDHSDAKQCMQGEDCPMHEGMKHPVEGEHHGSHKH